MKKSKKPTLITGILSKHKKGFGFVSTGDETDDIYISAKNMAGAMNGDEVEVALLPQYRREGVITSVCKRNTIEVVGVFYRRKQFGFVVPQGRGVCEDLLVRKKHYADARSGDIVVAKIIHYGQGKNSAEGKITEIISRQGEAGAGVKALIRQAGLRETFPGKVKTEAKKVYQEPVISEDRTKNRKDLREKTIFTIDGADAKDFDDAVCLELLPTGNYLLGVHIADVAHYVAEGGPMDKEALKRGNSVYLPDMVIPMLPPKLSTGICSLQPGKDRLTLSVDMEITAGGEVVSHEIYESLIHSKARLIYDDVSDMLEHKTPALIKEHKDIFEDLQLMEQLALILQKKRKNRGSLDFDLDEAAIILDEEGVPVSIDLTQRRTANKIIEEFMLLTNETVAEHFYWMETPFIYRVHQKPAQEKMEELKTFLENFGLTLKGSAEAVHPKTLSQILQKTEDQPYEHLINSVLLRSMQKADYRVQCEGHFGLALKYYCHFTSPIRRYSDLMIHRIIKDSLKGKLDHTKVKHYKEKTATAAEQVSILERKTMELERDVEKLKKAEYMSSRIGKHYKGVISGVTGFGIYVALDNTIEGMIRLHSLEDDYYEFEPEKYQVIGQRTQKTYSLGQPLEIKVASVDVEQREINFSLV